MPDNVKISAEYAAKVRAAVQAAHHVPQALAALNYSGRVRVEFHLRDRIPAQARVLVESGVGMIDRAALQAVSGAQYPAPPPELAGEDLIYQVWVEFNL
jgi:protein TonB